MAHLALDGTEVECLTVTDGRISRLTIVFDRAPSDAARRATAP